jgi:hypothetical protein
MACLFWRRVLGRIAGRRTDPSATVSEVCGASTGVSAGIWRRSDQDVKDYNTQRREKL